jgi:hypothetical protein
MTTSRNAILHGCAEQLQPLHAGAPTATLDGVDLRNVMHGERELMRQFYVAVRDSDCNTAPGAPADVEAELVRRSLPGSPCEPQH